MGNHHQRRRFVELLKIIHFIRSGKLLDNLAAWLEAFPPPVTCGKFGRMLSAVKKHFKITHDEARHSFISYHVAAYRSLGDAALQAGNSESIIKRRNLDYAKQHPNASAKLSAWIIVAAAAKWRSIADVRKVLPPADLATVGSAKTVTIFNIAGNHHRLISAIHYNTRSIFILKILTHSDYGKDRGKNHL